MSNRTRRKRNKKELLFVIVLLLVGGYGLMQLSAQSRSAEFVQLHLEAPDGSQRTHAIRAELATTPGARSHGLKFRQPAEFGARDGMLFVFPFETEQTFWMRDTFINLDMIFLNSQLRVVGILHDVPAGTTEERTIGRPSQYVLELLGGQSETLGIEEGWILRPHAELPVVSR